MLGDLKSKVVVLLGLTYKPGTNTLRRSASASVELCRWLVEQGVSVRAFDPAIRELPADLSAVQVASSADLALRGADAAYLATPWPEMGSISPLVSAEQMRRPLVLDPTRYLEDVMRGDDRIEYFTVGVSV